MSPKDIPPANDVQDKPTTRNASSENVAWNADETAPVNIDSDNNDKGACFDFGSLQSEKPQKVTSEFADISEADFAAGSAAKFAADFEAELSEMKNTITPALADVKSIEQTNATEKTFVENETDATEDTKDTKETEDTKETSSSC